MSSLTKEERDARPWGHNCFTLDLFEFGLDSDSKITAGAPAEIPSLLAELKIFERMALDEAQTRLNQSMLLATKRASLKSEFGGSIAGFGRNN